MTEAAGLALDHVVIAVSDLDEGASALSRLLGRGPSWRGRHPTYGSANVLYRLDNAYLELLAPEPDSTDGGTWTAQLRSFLDERGDGLFAIALATPDIAATVAAVRARGLPVGEPTQGEGVDLISGARRRWTNARVPRQESHGTSLFFIEHHSPPEALPVASFVAPAAEAVDSVVALSFETADAAGATKLWRHAVGLPETRTDDGWRFDLTNASLLMYAGTGEAEAPHRWRRLVLGVSRVTTLADRLERDGVRFDQGEFPEGWGVRADCCGVDVLLAEAEA
jgi:hypothetical protein